MMRNDDYRHSSENRIIDINNSGANDGKNKNDAYLFFSFTNLQNPFVTQCTYNGYRINSLLDTGADITVIGSR